MLKVFVLVLYNCDYDFLRFSAPYFELLLLKF